MAAPITPMNLIVVLGSDTIWVRMPDSVGADALHEPSPVPAPKLWESRHEMVRWMVDGAGLALTSSRIMDLMHSIAEIVSPIAHRYHLPFLSRQHTEAHFRAIGAQESQGRAITAALLLRRLAAT